MGAHPAESAPERPALAGAPAPYRQRALQIALPVLVAVVVGLFLAFVSVKDAWHNEFDLKVYRGAVQWWLEGKPLYAFHRNATPYGLTYPPFAAVAMLPWAAVSELTAMVLNELLSALVVVGITWWLVRPLAVKHGWPLWTAVGVAVPLVYLMEPVRETLAYGQVNLYLCALVLLDVVWLRRGRAFAGVGIGLATAIKLTPGIFIVYLAVTGRWRATVVAIGTFLAATLLAFAVAPSDSTDFWTHVLFQTSRIGRVDVAENQSALGLVSRLAGTGALGTLLWVVVAAVVLVAGLTRARQAWQRGAELTGVTLAGLTGCVVSPISWTHHLVWVVPAIVVLVDVAASPDGSRARRRLAGGGAVAVALIFGLSIVWYYADYIGNIHGGGPVVVLATNSYAVVLLALVAFLPVPPGDAARAPAYRGTAEARP